MRKRKKLSLLLPIGIIVIINTFILIRYISNRITPVALEISQREVDISINDYIFKSFSKDVINDNLDNLIEINKNKKGEIVNVNYNLKVAYRYLGETIDKLYSDIKEIKVKSGYYNSEDCFFYIPSGIITSSVFFSRFGFKIPIKIEMINEVKMHFETNVSSYGMNNSLLEIFLVIDTESLYTHPFNYVTKNNNYTVLLASKLIVGVVPSVYGGVINSSSDSLSS